MTRADEFASALSALNGQFSDVPRGLRGVVLMVDLLSLATVEKGAMLTNDDIRFAVRTVLKRAAPWVSIDEVFP